MKIEPALGSVGSDSFRRARAEDSLDWISSGSRRQSLEGAPPSRRRSSPAARCGGSRGRSPPRAASLGAPSRRHRLHRDEEVEELGPVGAGVDPDRAAERGRDARELLEPREPLGRGPTASDMSDAPPPAQTVSPSLRHSRNSPVRRKTARATPRRGSGRSSPFPGPGGGSRSRRGTAGTGPGLSASTPRRRPAPVRPPGASCEGRAVRPPGPPARRRAARADHEGTTAARATKTRAPERPGRHVVEDDARPAREALEGADGARLPDVEETEEEEGRQDPYRGGRPGQPREARREAPAA